MTRICISIILLLSILTMSSKSYSQDDFPVLEGPYLGQKPPGLIPEVFAPGIVSINGRFEHGISFSSDLDEIYFSANKKGEDAAIYFSKLEDKKWKSIQKAKFTKGKKAQEMQPFVTADGKRIYFTAYSSDFTDNKIWYVDRLDNAWSNAIKLDSPINDDEVFYSIQANNGDLYYFNISKRKTYYAPNDNGSFPKVKEVEIEFGVHASISPSQDYLVVNARNKEDDSRKSDIYVYFKEKDGTWTKPINLGDTVNSNFPETVPSVTPDGKYLFFSRYNEEGGLSNFYWVSTEVIENLRPK
jgi:Tol biopolymer transport system component